MIILPIFPPAVAEIVCPTYAATQFENAPRTEFTIMNSTLEVAVVGQREMEISPEGERALLEIENRPSTVTYEVRSVRQVSSIEEI